VRELPACVKCHHLRRAQWRVVVLDGKGNESNALWLCHDHALELARYVSGVNRRQPGSAFEVQMSRVTG
jgi:hypothetical protein